MARKRETTVKARLRLLFRSSQEARKDISILPRRFFAAHPVYYTLPKEWLFNAGWF